MNASLKDNKALAPKYKGVPRRYEDTKPVQTQGFTHSAILDIGQNIHVKWENKTEEEKEAAIAAAEEAVWQQAQHVKEIALEKCREEAKKVLEDKIKELHVEREKALKEQTIKVESDMKLIAIEQVKKERERADGVLKETVAKLIAEKDEERVTAVAVARKEEIEKAEAEAQRVAKETYQKAADTAKEAADDKANALKDLTARMNKEKADAVFNTQMEERRAAAIELGKVQTAHNLEVAKLKEEIESWKVRHQEALGEIEREKGEKEDWIQKNNALKTSFQLFIDETKGFKQGQADFLI
ncbi:hypothetical protein HOLleu_33636 [Holothuria leucospilota]|uniref:Uncharacterized protein n=1 Tax=Holothuria leucospilota TaxID=206669 RepID=A0A9Q0YP24_HOLLE|nr:hypothetical protein HOLleu_33636 [Holothuria leucospilota]